MTRPEKRYTLIICVVSLFLSRCGEPPEYKIIETPGFIIEVPGNWEYVQENGMDSFVGRIVGDSMSLSFDKSSMGYANHLIESEEEYLESGFWDIGNAPYMKPGVIYTSGDVKGERDRTMKEKGITDTALVLVEKIQKPEREVVKEDGEYWGILTFKDTSVKLKIQIPEETTQHEITVDTVSSYIRKIIRPKEGYGGMTGIYLEKINSGSNFNLYGYNLSRSNQEKAIRAFKTIKIKE